MDKFNKIIENAINEVFDKFVTVALQSTNQQFGDFTTNVALVLAKQLAQKPQDIASQITDKLSKINHFSEVSITNPGFINIRLDDQALIDIISNPKIEQSNINEVVVIETNNPNAFKAMHIGHAYNAILADTIANLLQASGAKLHRVSYHGDIGSHVGKSMYSLLRFVDGNPDKLNQIALKDRNSFMSKMYAEGAKFYEQNNAAKSEINRYAQESFNPSDPIYKQVYNTCFDWSMKQIEQLNNKLGNKPVEKRYLESQVNNLGEEIIKLNKYNVFVKSDGAWVFPGSKYGSFDNVFVNSSGRGLYGARDLGLILQKNKDFNPQKSYIVTAQEQKDYLKGVIKAAELSKLNTKGQTINISTGAIKLTTGKMSSRKGDVVEVSWLFDRIRQEITALGQEPRSEIIIATLRYQFLKVRIGSDIVFDIAEAININGNTGPYLQYAYARAVSITNKIAIARQAKLESLKGAERNLLLKILDVQQMRNRAINELAPSIIANSLYELTQYFNKFYETSRVIGDPRQDERLAIIEIYKKTLKSGLELLGIPILNKM